MAYLRKKQQQRRRRCRHGYDTSSNGQAQFIHQEATQNVRAFGSEKGNLCTTSETHTCTCVYAKTRKTSSVSHRHPRRCCSLVTYKYIFMTAFAFRRLSCLLFHSCVSLAVPSSSSSRCSFLPPDCIHHPPFPSLDVHSSASLCPPFSLSLQERVVPERKTTTTTTKTCFLSSPFFSSQRHVMPYNQDDSNRGGPIFCPLGHVVGTSHSLSLPVCVLRT